MSSLNRRYAVTLPGPVGSHGPPTVVVVHVTEETGPDGSPVWESTDGDLRVEIRGEVATVLDAPADGPQRSCLHAVELP
ncbi:DUF6296 family protein [Kitasatospora sp. NPDC057542]|uniref:DUF6296 family protein n=1 Tax=Streptomycetaceae TaxID=2062 RepID=UPI001CC9F011|nr:DUF6296 family protein [Streptomyces sp. LS1784]